MDFTGHMYFSLILLPLFLIGWILKKYTLKDLGIQVASVKDFLTALSHPILVIGLILFISFRAEVIEASHADWMGILYSIVLQIVIGIVVLLVAEEGFFRGLLWAWLEKNGSKESGLVYRTALAFALWELILCFIKHDGLTAQQPFTFVINTLLLGMIWGQMRLKTGSILVPALSHAVWNALILVLFGTGQQVGLLTLSLKDICSPEVGLLGIILNGAYIWANWLITRSDD